MIDLLGENLPSNDPYLDLNSPREFYNYLNTIQQKNFYYFQPIIMKMKLRTFAPITPVFIRKSAPQWVTSLALGMRQEFI